MLQNIHNISKPVGLKMHLGRTKVMCNKHVNKDEVNVDWKKIEEVHRYIYLGQMVTKNHDQEHEMKEELDRDGVHSASWTTSCETKCVNETEEESI